ncbi:SufE family protein [Meiothermus rufus]|uniref:SufE family protein n=1 Tax=Meiothermus rufus TaxID=604332 RepID=UPI000419322A|nr:SufE family protein [Meiothermus rufus]
MSSEERLAKLPAKLQNVVRMLAGAPKVLKTEMLLAFAQKMPPLPAGMQGRLEQVHECTTPFFVHAEIENAQVRLYFDAPKEAPTVRAFAGMLAEGLEGESPEAVLGVPEDFYTLARLEEIITPLRLRGLQAVLSRIKRQVREALESNPRG